MARKLFDGLNNALASLEKKEAQQDTINKPADVPPPKTCPPVTEIATDHIADVSNMVASPSIAVTTGGQIKAAGRIKDTATVKTAHKQKKPSGSDEWPVWRYKANKYYLHHFSCRYCIAAGQNKDLKHCDVGLMLWTDYINEFKRNS